MKTYKDFMQEAADKGRPRGAPHIENVRFWDLPKEELNAIIKDAKEAMKAYPGNSKNTSGPGNYADQINDAGTVLAWRRKKGISEGKFDYELYHQTYTNALDEAYALAKKRGYDVDMDDVWEQVSIGPKRPSYGKSNSFHIALTKNGKPVNKYLHIQIYGRQHDFELNAYIQ